MLLVVAFDIGLTIVSFGAVDDEVAEERGLDNHRLMLSLACSFIFFCDLTSRAACNLVIHSGLRRFCGSIWVKLDTIVVVADVCSIVLEFVALAHRFGAKRAPGDERSRKARRTRAQTRAAEARTTATKRRNPSATATSSCPLCCWQKRRPLPCGAEKLVPPGSAHARAVQMRYR